MTKNKWILILTMACVTTGTFCQTNTGRWKDTFIYQIYPRSFKDSNGDGVGDLKGITSQLDYLKDLGVETIWMSPIYKSPMDDMGYDIANYNEVDPIFGTMADFDEMLAAMKKRNIRLVLDQVVNHTSDEHPWFTEARKSKDNPYHNYYIWKAGKPGVPPNNWFSFFGGSAWEWNEPTQEYYLHLFSKKQPDLNWENPELRKEIYKSMLFWLDKGVNGFRMDVITLLSKNQQYADLRMGTSMQEMMASMDGVIINGPRIHEFLNEMNKNVLSKYDVYTVGEGAGITLENIDSYTDPKKPELQTFYIFEHMFVDRKNNQPVPLDIVKFKSILSSWSTRLSDKGINTIYLGNHDQVRSLSRFGNDKNYHNKSGKMLATLLFTQTNIPFFLQGDELGMTNTTFNTVGELRDIAAINGYTEAIKNAPADVVMKSLSEITRDQARTPFQWNSTTNAGFTSGTPWLKVNPNYVTINAQDEAADPNSILSFYKKMIRLRKENSVLIHGKFEDLAPANPQIYAYTRSDKNQKYLVVLNMTDSKASFKLPASPGKLLSSNYADDHGDTLRPYEAKIYKK